MPDNLTEKKHRLLKLLAQEQDLSSPESFPVQRRKNPEIAAPLSSSQQRLWFLDQLEPGSPLYTVYAGFRLHGDLNWEALEWSIREIVRRHENLRTRFSSHGADAVQIVSPDEGTTIFVDDLSALGEAEREREIQRAATEELRHPFDLSAGPLFRVRLLRLREQEHVLLLFMHHIITDEWSMGVLFAELSQLYGTRKMGGGSPLKELGIQYADYAVWQTKWLTSDLLERGLNYWKQQLLGAPAVLDLPTDHARPGVMKHCGTTHSFVLPEKLSRSLRELSRREGATLFMTLLAAFAALLSKLSGQEDVPVGIPIANRTRAELEGLIGFFVNTLVIRADVGVDLSFRELVGRIKEVALGAYAHQDVPFEMVVQALQPERSLSHAPLFQVMFMMQTESPGGLQLNGLQVEEISMRSWHGTAKFDLTLSVQNSNDGLVCAFEYNTDLFEASTIERMTLRLERLLEEVTKNPQTPLSQIGVLGEAERKQVLVEWNRTEARYPQKSSIHQAFEEQVEKTPEAAAVTCGVETLSYAQLNGRANQVAHFLREQGISLESTVGICVERSLTMLVGILGILKAGGAYVPLDPNYPAERLTYMAKDARLKLVLTEELLTGRAGGHGIESVCIDRDWTRMAGCSSENPGVTAGVENLAYVIYTSGSTGQPKGVEITHGSCVALMQWSHAVFDRSSLAGVLASTSMCFDLSVFEFFVPLSCGGTVIVAENALTLTHLPAANQVTLINTVPSVFAELLSVGGVPATVRVVNLAGEPLRGQLVDKVLALGTVEQVWNLFGPTEDTTYSTYLRMGPDRDKEKEPTIGVPIANSQAYVLDERLEPVGVGIEGELYLGGAGLARGYLNRPGLTAQKFVPNPFRERGGLRLYRTGDRARWLADGQLVFLGRQDDQVKIRGFRIELGEIETVLLGIAEISEAIVIVREDLPGDKRLVGYVVGRGGETPDVNEIRMTLKAKMPEYMVPGLLVVLERMPLTANGKIDRRALPAAASRRAEIYEDPRTAEEEIVAGVWAQVLEVERVGMDENFFELGGHSLLATRVMSRIQSTLHVEMPLRAMFEHPTVRGFVEAVEATRRVGRGPAIPELAGRKQGEMIPLSHAQQRLWFLDQLDPGSALYNVYVGYRLQGQLDGDVLEWSLREIVRRHETLRTRFASSGGAAQQLIGTAESFALIRLQNAKDGIAIKEFLTVEAARPFDLSEGPVFRATLMEIGVAEHLLVLAMHHIVTDAWSMGCLLEELSHLYHAGRSGQVSSLKELTIQYADYAIWQRGWLTGAVLDQELDYWKNRLTGASEMLELPTDYPRPAVMKHTGATHSFTLPERLSHSMRTLGHWESSTLFMVLMAGYAALLSRLAGQDDISVGIPIANRNRTEVEPLIGFLVNTLVIRTDVAGEQSFRELVKQVRETTVGAYAHQDVPFELIVDTLRPERSLSHSPLFQAMFTMQSESIAWNAALDGLSVERVEMTAGPAMAKFDLTLAVHESSSGLECEFEYSTELFEAKTIDRMARQLAVLLESAVADPNQAVNALALLTEADRRELLVEWNRTEFECPASDSVVGLFEKQANRHPASVAVAHGKEKFTYSELNERANQLAHHLRTRGVGVESRVGICVGRSVEMVVGILGIMKAGGAYVPLDPSYPPGRLNYMMKDAELNLLLTQETMREQVQAHGIEVLCIDGGKDWQQVARQSRIDPEPAAGPENAAYVIYTSGSTGLPKGVVVSHANLLHSTLARWKGYPEPVTRFLLLSSICFDSSVAGVFWTLSQGGALHLPEGSDQYDVENLAWHISYHKISHLLCIPSLYLALLSEAPSDFGHSLRAIIVAGESCPSELVHRHEQASLESTLYNEYGPTEASVWCTVYQHSAGQQQRCSANKQ